MAKDIIQPEQVSALTKELLHEYFSGTLEPWFSYLDEGSVYLGMGEPLLFGGDAIREHFKGFAGKKMEIWQEEYFPVALGEDAAQVCGQLLLQSPGGLYRVCCYFTFCYRMIKEKLRLIHQHVSYEYIQLGESETLSLDLNTRQFVRSLLLERPSGRRIPVRSKRQTLFVDPYTIIYAQSQRKKTDLICIDRVISCSSPIGALAKELPKIFYPLHRGYLINTLYLVAIRRFEAELISGISIPIPAAAYQRVRRDLQKISQGSSPGY